MSDQTTDDMRTSRPPAMNIRVPQVRTTRSPGEYYEQLRCESGIREERIQQPPQAGRKWHKTASKRPRSEIQAALRRELSDLLREPRDP